jgi:peptidoglycan/LPS O-acetylase OafA/YrhL
VAWGAAIGIALWEAQRFGHELPSGRALAATLLLVQSWTTDLGDAFSLNSVEWSLSAEAFFYLVFPAVALVAALLGRRGRHVGLGLCAGAVLAVNALGWLRLGTSPWDVHARCVTCWVEVAAPPFRLAEFALGMLLAAEVREGGLAGLRVWHAVAALGVALALKARVPLLWGQAVTLLPLAALIAALAIRDRDGRPTALAHPALVRLGEWSFAFYLLHQLVIRAAVLTGATPRALTSPGFALLCLAVAVALSGALFTLVERPAERRLTQRRRQLRIGVPALEPS